MDLFPKNIHISYREYALKNTSFINQVNNFYKKLKLIRTGKDIFIGKDVQFHNISEIHLSKGVTIGDYSVIYCDDECKIIIGENSTLQGFNYIQSSLNSIIEIRSGVAINIGSKIIGGNISIGNDSMISHDVSIVGVDHVIKKDRPATHSKTKFGKIIIKDNVWIGCRSIILKNVTIGNHAIVGAGSVVTKDVESGTIVAGNPAKIIGYVD